jgi:hypothetical protein
MYYFIDASKPNSGCNGKLGKLINPVGSHANSSVTHFGVNDAASDSESSVTHATTDSGDSRERADCNANTGDSNMVGISNSR